MEMMEIDLSVMSQALLISSVIFASISSSQPGIPNVCKVLKKVA